jgi:hypothetical protein
VKADRSKKKSRHYVRATIPLNPALHLLGVFGVHVK